MARLRTATCSKCGSMKITMPNGASRCVPCHRRWGREYYQRSELRRAKSRRSYVLRKYGADIPDLEQILHQQGGCCAICRRPWPLCVPQKRTRYETIFLHYLCVDHDHRTGKIRGLLCNACNTAIGLFEEDVTRFAEAVRYLRRHGAGFGTYRRQRDIKGSPTTSAGRPDDHGPTGKRLTAFETLRARAADRADIAEHPTLFDLDEGRLVTEWAVGA